MCKESITRNFVPNHTGRRSHAHSLSSATIFDRQFSSSKSMHATDSYRPAEDLLFSSLAGLSLSLITELLSHTLLASSPPEIALSRALGFLALSFSLSLYLSVSIFFCFVILSSFFLGWPLLLCRYALSFLAPIRSLRCKRSKY